MSQTVQGLATPQVEAREVFDPATGWHIEIDHIGAPTLIEPIKQGYVLAGIRVRQRTADGVAVLTSSWSTSPGDVNGGGQEVAVDDLEVDNEEVQISLFAHPRVDAEAYAYNPANRADYKKKIEEAVKNGEPYPLPASYEYGALVYRELARGIEAFNRKQPVLRRRRTYSVRYTQPRTQIDADEKIYTTAALVREFNIPQAVSALLPLNPSQTPVGSVWGWRLRQDNTRYVQSIGKHEETRDFIFAAWPTWLHTVIS